MADLKTKYRKLPGRRRSIASGASLWMGDDHLLSVKSYRFHERYKRFYYRDIQAIVVSKESRYHLSTRAMGIGLLFGVAIAIGAFKLPWLAIALGSVLAGLIVVWLYACATGSCSGVLYTAVSREDLPSIYRLRIARKVLGRLEPRIREVQGALPENWAQVAENCSLGPRDPMLVEVERETAAESPKAESPVPVRRSRTVASGIFLAGLLGDGVLTVVDLISSRPWLEWAMNMLVLTYLAAAIWIFVQHQRKVLRAGMQMVAVAALLLLGITFYAQTFSVAFESARYGKQPAVMLTSAQPIPRLVREIYAGGALILVLAGVFLSFQPSE